MTYSTKPLAYTLLAAFLGFAPQLAHGQDASAGRDYFLRECIRCHTFECNKDGPHLSGLVGRTVGSVDDYDGYSQGFLDADLVWSLDLLDEYLAAPGVMFPDSTKAWYGLIEDANLRQNLIEFLKTEDPAVNLCF